MAGIVESGFISHDVIMNTGILKKFIYRLVMQEVEYVWVLTDMMRTSI